MSVIPHFAGARTIGEPARMKTALEIRADEISAKQRLADEREYRRLCFVYAEHDLTDAEITTITGLADKLGFSPAQIDYHRTAIRQLKSDQREADAPVDIPALKAAVDQNTKTARTAFEKFLVEFAGKLDSLASIGDAMSDFRKAFWSQATGDPLPENFKSLITTGQDSIRSVESAEQQRPRALNRIGRLKMDNRILWPKE